MNEIQQRHRVTILETLLGRKVVRAAPSEHFSNYASGAVGFTLRAGLPGLCGWRRARRCRPLPRSGVRMADESGGAAGSALHCIACGVTTERRMTHPLRVKTITTMASFHWSPLYLIVIDSEKKSPTLSKARHWNHNM